MNGDLLSIRQTVARAKSEGICIPEASLRYWVKTGEIPARMAGTVALLYYPNVIRYITCADCYSQSGAR